MAGLVFVFDRDVPMLAVLQAVFGIFVSVLMSLTGRSGVPWLRLGPLSLVGLGGPVHGPLLTMVAPIADGGMEHWRDRKQFPFAGRWPCMLFSRLSMFFRQH